LIKKNLSIFYRIKEMGHWKIKEMNTSALLADDVGLGYTITTGIILKEI
jgi:hypothetical protein